MKKMIDNILLFWNSIKNSNLKPSVEVQVSDFEAARFIHVNVKALTLIYIASTTSSHLDQCSFFNFPRSSELNCRMERSEISDFRNMTKKIKKLSIIPVNRFQVIRYLMDISYEPFSLMRTFFILGVQSPILVKSWRRCLFTIVNSPLSKRKTHNE